MNTAKLTIVRHGRTDWNAEGRVQGSIDRPLDEVGKQQSLSLFQELKNLPVTKIVSSDLQRAYMTAKILSEGFSSQLEVHPALRERHYGQRIEGQLWKDFRLEYKQKIAEYENLDWSQRKKFKYSQTSESYEEVLARVIPFLQDLCEQNSIQHMIVVTHGGVMKALLAELAGANDRCVHTQNTGYMTLNFKGGKLLLEESKGIQLVSENK